jgi:hypothetical protein
MKDGGEHWQWDPEIPCYFGVLPRHGAKGGDVKVHGHKMLRFFLAFTNHIGDIVVSVQKFLSRTRSQRL